MSFSETNYHFILIYYILFKFIYQKRVYFIKMCLNFFFGSNQIQLKSYQQNWVYRLNYVWISISYQLSSFKLKNWGHSNGGRHALHTICLLVLWICEYWKEIIAFFEHIAFSPFATLNLWILKGKYCILRIDITKVWQKLVMWKRRFFKN